jgi:hypothetical protein
MRYPVPDRVAHEFLKHFLWAFERNDSLYLAIRQAREQLQGIEDQFPCASWLPVLCQNPAVLVQHGGNNCAVKKLLKAFAKSIFPFCLLVLVCASSYPAPASAQTNANPPKRIVYTPPDRKGTPPAGNQTGSRGNCPKTEIPLLALGGNSGYTLTISESPILWFYIPYTSDRALSGEFELQDESGKTVYQTPVSLPTTPKIISIRLTQPLQLNQRYRWYLAVNCPSAPEKERFASEGYVTGLVQRILLPAELEQQLKMARSPLERLQIYANHGIWYDTLTELAQLYLAQPTSESTWKDFLEDVGLDSIANATLDSSELPTTANSPP